jgi:hypothetical protein
LIYTDGETPKLLRTFFELLKAALTTWNRSQDPLDQSTSSASKFLYPEALVDWASSRSSFHVFLPNVIPSFLIYSIEGSKDRDLATSKKVAQQLNRISLMGNAEKIIGREKIFLSSRFSLTFFGLFSRFDFRFALLF